MRIQLEGDAYKNNLLLVLIISIKGIIIKRVNVKNKYK